MQIPRSLTVAECWQHVGSRGVGRIGFDAGSGPRIHPVDYSCDGSDVFVRTASTSELAPVHPNLRQGRSGGVRNRSAPCLAG